ncbi:MAG: PorV/PorQ family protein [Elusimicrobia bacterium]|nr:PorV/PorQ family protein [Elusimicrobiota bacterium]
MFREILERKSLREPMSIGSWQSLVLFIAFTTSYFLLPTSCLYAGSGTSGARILNQTVSARTVGMGEAFVAVCDDTNALYYNPAGLVNIEGNEIASMYLKGRVDENYGLVGWVGTPSNGIGSFGASFLYYDGGNFEWNNLDGTSRNVKAQQDIVGTIGYGKEIFNNFSLGLTAKYLSSKLVETYSGTAYAVDFGILYYTTVDGLSTGLAVQNVGTKLKYIEQGDALPMNIRLGIAYNKTVLQNHSFLIAIDTVKPNESNIRENIGIEYSFKETVFLRFGYKVGYDIDKVTLGAGFQMKGLKVDYGIGLVETLNPNQRVSIGYSFGSE